jgi:cytochrome bd ubiquinol oxidase subunit II
MFMTEIIILVLGVAILLYVLLGGADFGAGMVELFTGKKGMDTISKAIAPVWEANHVWLILAVVILFNGFPPVYATLTTFLHIPLLLVLLGIVFRGTAFTFRYYDAIRDKTHDHYTTLFRISSLLTPFFLGITLGAIILGRIPANSNVTFCEGYISPWFNLFSILTGLFLTLLFGWLASVYLIGEAHEKNTYDAFVKVARRFFILLILSGFGVFLMAAYDGLHFFNEFTHSPVSIGCVIAATIMIPLLWRNIQSRNILWTRLLAGAQTACILVGWFAIQFPVMVFIADGSHLTIWNSQAPQKTMLLLVIALIIGVVIILPSFAYLFTVFKFRNKEEETKI